ncbi:Ldh family oxidoreductase [Acidianus brierleyi]|uniref:Ldh family oxidoreductase n=1 Tax=Acidianus brierleyi TaxID=41673 RepID=A0A2U9ICF6_9CREN|nr:Ldh family oxidoreductase [Acidianus brierleyi]AWR93693.1 hypothetical protein DFR85_02750 [Acidianus brierleyi]
MIVNKEDLYSLVFSIFQKITFDEYAKILAEELVNANLAGHEDHGVQLVPYYVKLAKGEKVNLGGTIIPPINPKARIDIQRNDFLIKIDGKMTFGQVILRKASEEKVENFKIFLGRNVSHIGRLSSFTENFAKKGFITLLVARTPPLISLEGMKGRILGNNPISISFPGDPPITIDMALSKTSFGKVVSSLYRGEKIEEGMILNAEGKGTSKPEDLINGGSLLPIGGYKGFNLALAIEILTSLFSEDVDINPFFGIVIREDLIGNEKKIEKIKERIPTTPFYHFPGSRKVEKENIDLPDSLWDQLIKINDSIS